MHKNSGTKRLTLADDLTIYHAQAHKEKLLDALSGTHKLELDLSAVGDMDSAGLQLLMLVKREAVQHDKEVIITGHSPAVQQTLDFCNLIGVFGDPVVISARQ